MNEEVAGDEDLELWHTKDYIQAMQAASAGEGVSNLWKYISGDNMNPKTRKFPEGIEAAARVIVKNSMFACDLVEEGKCEKAVSIGGGLHHAKPNYGEGFCVYNDVVICAKHAIGTYGLERVLVLDTDAHAGNGTCQAAALCRGARRALRGSGTGPTPTAHSGGRSQAVRETNAGHP